MGQDESTLLKLGLPECPVEAQMSDVKKAHGSKPRLARRRPSQRAANTLGDADAALEGAVDGGPDVRPDEGEILLEDHEEGSNFRPGALLKSKIARRRPRGLGAVETLGDVNGELEVPAQTLLARWRRRGPKLAFMA